ncbi:hypothetical protein ATCC90586_007551 [Pythium insidiosum]|nr:hypothetical protein ATCC90586_007551 [Pythium insidiosum]
MEPIIEEHVLPQDNRPTPGPQQPNRPQPAGGHSASDNSVNSNSQGSSSSSIVANGELLIAVLGGVGAVAVIVGAVLLRRDSSDGKARASDSTLSRKLGTAVVDEEDDDFLESGPRRSVPSPAFSPIQVRAGAFVTHSTPGNERESRTSYFI